MYDFIIDEIKKKVYHGEKKYYIVRTIKYQYLLLLYLKFKCNEKGITDFTNQEKLKTIISDDKLSIYAFFFEHELHELLIHLQNSNIQELLNDFIPEVDYNQFEKIDNLFIYKKDKVVYLYKELVYANRLVIGQTDSSNLLLTKIYNMIDEMKGRERIFYNKLDNVNLKEFDTIVIVDNEPPYRYISSPNDFIDIISEIFLSVREFKGRIILKTSYSNISIIKKNYLIRNYLSKAILYENSNINDAILIFSNTDKPDKTSIIMINKDIEDDYNQIKKIIDEDVPDNSCLIRIDPEVIISNNSRIGFKMYLANKTEEVKSINDIIDENTIITEKITRLNKKIQQEMDKLISK